jgi:aminoglycoside phosphotransferase family enzyme
MAQESSREELERKLEQARRLAARTTDQTTLQRLSEFADELMHKLQRILQRRAKFGSTEDHIRTRARELWEQNGRPTGRDQEFWLQAEREIKEGANLERPDDI